jgi:undecaprenyl-diphosphatase
MADACSSGIDTGFATLDYTQAAILGVVQGITELLPISSTAHMRIVPHLLGWQDPGSAFSAAMQLAALAAVVSFFWADIKSLAVSSVQATFKRQFDHPAFRFVLGIGLATLPIGIVGILMSKWLNTCDTSLRSLPVIGASCVLMAVLMGVSELTSRHDRDLASFSYRDLLLVGLAQVGALIPGVSRSGSTLTAALFLGFKREDAARLSFLLGLPAITLAGLKEIWVLAHAGLDWHAWSILAVGLLCGSLSAFLAVWGLLHLFERMASWPFVVYRGLMGLWLLYNSL